ncbi:hypothetical protein [Aminipila sp.]|uniref:hypothetical protein n=1 Tax=Aminipila sp. TaxID=2060095 RepID=UPI0028A27359|nr:hypothetical protein [Aminipila sp.]
MKKYIKSIYLVLAIVLCFQTTAFAGEISPSRIGGSGVGYTEEVTSDVIYKSDAFIAWHPDFSGYQKNISAYFFLRTKASINISIGGTYASVSYNPASNGSGFVVAANSSKATRPAIYGDTYKITYKAGMYNYNTKKWQSYSIQTRYAVRDTYIVAVEK